MGEDDGDGSRWEEERTERRTLLRAHGSEAHLPLAERERLAELLLLRREGCRALPRRRAAEPAAAGWWRALAEAVPRLLCSVHRRRARCG